MACRTATAVTAVAVLLIVDQVASAAFIAPEVVVMRLKRNAEPMRSFSFSGFNPNGQMAAFTGAAEYPMFANYMPQPSQYNPYNYDGPQELGGSYGPQQTAQNAYGPQKATQQQDSYGPPPSGVAEQQPTKKQQPYGGDVNGQESGPKPSGVAPADSKEQISNSAEQADDNTNNYSNNNNNNNKKQYRGKAEGPSSNAEASFNAWFPIMFGVFPNGAQGTGQQSGSPDRSNNNNNNNNNNQANQPQQQQQGGNGYERLGGTTVIANSVSNGRNGVATSHAIAYGNPRSSSK